MSAIRLRGATSGTTDVVAAAIAGDGVMTLPSGTGTLATAAYVDAAVAAGGKVLQVVRATDSTLRSTTSTSFVDITGMTVTITPKISTSAVMLIAVVQARRAATNEFIFLQISDSSNGAISGAEAAAMGSTATGAANQNALQTLIGYATPGTTSATTYKLRFKGLNGGTVEVVNDVVTGQLFAIEVAT